jgi:hypothetical protein
MERGEAIRETENVSTDIIVDMRNNVTPDNRPDIIKDSVIEATQATPATQVTNNVVA